MQSKTKLLWHDIVNPDPRYRRKVRALAQKYDGQIGSATKHDPNLPPVPYSPIAEDVFWQTCGLDEYPLMSMTGANVGRGLMNDVPLVPTNLQTRKIPFITSYDIDRDSTPPPSNDCEVPRGVLSKYTSCYLSLPFGCLGASMPTRNVTELIDEVCYQNDFSNVSVIGDVLGGATYEFLDMGLPGLDRRNIIQAGAITRGLLEVGTWLNKHVRKQFWTGDPTNNPVSDQTEFLGLMAMLSGNYPATMSQYLVSNGGDCSQLSADVKNLGSCVGSGSSPSLWDLMQEAENTVSIRESQDGVTRGDLVLAMHPYLWRQVAEHISCASINQGCSNAVVMANDGANGYAVQENLRRVREGRRLTIGGNTFRVVEDATMPINQTSNGNGSFNVEGSIVAIPLRINNQRTLWFDYKDYRKISDVISPLTPYIDPGLGWSDNGRFLHTVSRQSTCIQWATQLCTRLWFTASRWSWRIDGVSVCNWQEKPAYNVL